MNTDEMPSQSVRRGTEEVLGRTTEWTLTSIRNSRVWRVRSNLRSFVVKQLWDQSSDPWIERDVMQALGTHRGRPITAIRNIGDGSCLVIAPYLDGTLVADRLEGDPPAPEEATLLANQYHSTLRLIATLPLPYTGFGRIGSGHVAGHWQWSMALRSYLEEQRAKGPKCAAVLYRPLSDALNRLARRLDSECTAPHVIPTDVNNRNFLLTEGQDSRATRLVALNLPVIWQGDPLMPFGALQLHLDDTHVATTLSATVAEISWRIHFYAAYHAFVISVFAERFAPQPWSEVCPWGRHRSLLQLFWLHHEAMKEHF